MVLDTGLDRSAPSTSGTSPDGEVFSAGAVQAAGRDVVALLAEAERLQAAALDRLALVDRAGLAELWGYASTERLIAHRAAVSNRAGRDLVALARHLASHPETARAVADGRVSLAQATELATAARGLSDAYRLAEHQLIAACRGRDVDEVGRLARSWRAATDRSEAATDAEHRFTTRGVWLQVGLDGSCSGSLRLDPIGAQALHDALDTVPDPVQLPHPPRTLPQRRADRLVDICHEHIDPDATMPWTHTDTGDTAETDSSGGTDDADPDDTVGTDGDLDADSADGRGHADSDVNDHPSSHEAAAAGDLRRNPVRPRRWVSADVIIDVETLAGGCPTTIARLRSELACGASIHGPALDRILCDASFRALITDGPRAVLAYNRATPAIPPALRRAVIVRDRRCQFHGCDRPHTWCDLHHLEPRHRGGPTTLANLALVCRFHHGLVHEGGWQLTRAPDGTVETTSP